MNSLLARRRRKADINIVPLIDVLTVLIFFFLVSMQFREQLTLNLTLPQVETAGRNEFSSPIVIGIDRDGVIFFNGTPASIKDSVEPQTEPMDVEPLEDRTSETTRNT